MENNRRPILYKGEVYSKVIEKRSGGDSKQPHLTYDQARTRVLADIAVTKSEVASTPADKKLPHEFVICVRMSQGFSAKSYYPKSLFDSIGENGQAEEIGSRIWRDADGEDSLPDTGKLFFVRTTNAGLEQLESKLSQEEDSVTKAFAYDVRKIEAVNTLTADEQILGIPSNWEEGRLEAVLHPFAQDKDLVLSNFLNLLGDSGANLEKVKYKQYESGVTFVSLYGDKEIIAKVAEYNPLRTIHPLDLRDLPKINRGSPINGGPDPAQGTKPEVVVGVFDGGINPNNPYLENYTEDTDAIHSPQEPDYIDHGTQVCGAVLYGSLNDYSSGQTLPDPKVSVKSFRVLPPNDLADPDLYEVIDAIEEVVPNNLDIKVFNLSLGPNGPILDDHISRFTFACDLLSAKYNILFTVAVGNDGKLDGGLARIQSPSDIVNGLGIGSYTKKDGKLVRAPYSCLGPGREGNKLKPDLLAFGGCDQYPIHLISHNLNEKIWNMGTSFASPIVAGYAGQLIGYSEGAIDPLVARALLIHTVNSENISTHNNELGHGTLAETVEDVVTCKSNSYTLIYKGELLPGKFAEFKIPWDNSIDAGKVNFRWSIAVSTAIDPQSPDDYTASSIVMSFYPNSNKFIFSKKGEGKKTINIVEQSAIAQQLLESGWEQAKFPVSGSAPVPYAPEDELRADMKWDSVDTRNLNKMVSSVTDPIFHIHALSRGRRYANRKIRFAVIMTVEPTDETVDLYSKVIAKFDALVPIKLNLEVTSQVNIES